MAPFRAVTAAAILTLAGSIPAQTQIRQEPGATPWVEVHAARVRLVGGQPGIGGAAYVVGLEIALADGWKTYWRMPGDSGVPPSFDWGGSRNLQAASVLYPAPARLPEAGGEAIGYKGVVLLPISVTPQNPALPVSLKLVLEFGICRDICIPSTATLGLDLVPARTAAPPGALLAAIERVPRPHHSRRANDPELKRVRIAEAGSATLEIEGIFKGSAHKADVFVEAPEGLYVPIPKQRAAEEGADNVIRFESELSPSLAKDLRGKTLTLTLVDDAGASEARWTFP